MPDHYSDYRMYPPVLPDPHCLAKRIYAKTHMISIVPIVAESINEGYSDKQMMEWFVNFFSGKKSATTSKAYNDAAGRYNYASQVKTMISMLLFYQPISKFPNIMHTKTT